MSGRDIGASVRQRLLNQSRAQERPFQESEPVGLTGTFRDDPARAIQWRAFVRRSRFTDQPGELRRLTDDIRRFAIKPIAAVAEKKTFKAFWLAGGPWAGTSNRGAQ